MLAELLENDLDTLVEPLADTATDVPSTKNVCVFTICRNLRPKATQTKSAAVQVSPVKTDVALQTCGRVVYDTASQTTVTQQLQVHGYCGCELMPLAVNAML